MNNRSARVLEKKSGMLYLMHIPWNWIKQRPHFIAEGLSEYYRLSVFAPPGDPKSPRPDRFSLRNYPALFSNNNKLPGRVNYYYRLFYFFLTAWKFRLIWISYPSQFNYMKRILGAKQILIYDCMDDALEFYSGNLKNSQLHHLEKDLIQRANIVIVSSEALKETLCQRYAVSSREKFHVVNNGIKDPEKICPVDLPQHIEQYFSESGPVKTMVYIGTISNWLDKESILYCLNNLDRIRIILVGPCEGDLPLHERLAHIGPVDHDYVFSIMSKSDVLIMPFVINKLVLGVNPVKVYEYIYSGKPVILRSYPETERFADFVHLYDTKENFLHFAEQVTKGTLEPKAGADECIEFAKQNTWGMRVSRIHSIISNVKLN